MRRALATVGALIALSGVAVGCGDDDGGSNAGGNGGGGETSAADFCDSARDLEDTFADTDMESPDALDDAIEQLESLDVPSEIRDDFDNVIEAFRALSDIDLSDPAAMEELASSDVFKNVETSTENIETFLREECGIDSSGDSGDGADAGEGNG